MSKAKIIPARAAVLKAKTQSIASKLPATRNADGSIKPRDKTGGKGTKPAASKTKAAPAATKPADTATKAAPANIGKPWSDAHDEQLRKLVAEGHPHAEIAKRLERTEAGVAARIETLKIFKGGDTKTEIAVKLLAGPKPGNGQHAQTLAQVASDGKDAVKKDEPEQDELAPIEVLELPMRFLSAALSIAPKDDTRYYLNGVYVHQLDDRTVRLVATDGHRLFLASVEHDKRIEWAQAGVILPREELVRIEKFLGKDAEKVEVRYGLKHPSMTLLEIGGIAQFTVKPIDGKFPDYQRVVDSSAAVFTAEREELTQTTIDAKYLKAAGALSAALNSKGIIPFLAPQDATYASVFAFADVPEALLYVMAQRNDKPALAAPTIALFGADAMRAQLAKLEEQIKHTRANAKAAKHEKFRVQFEQKADRLQLRADQIRANLSTKLTGPTVDQSPAVKAPAEAAAGVAVH